MAVNYDRRLCAIVIKDKEKLAQSLRDIDPKILYKPYKQIYTLIRFYYEKHKSTPSFEILEEKIQQNKSKIFPPKTNPEDIILSIRTEMEMSSVKDYESVVEELKTRASQDCLKEGLPEIIKNARDSDIKSALEKLNEVAASVGKLISQSTIQRSDNHDYIDKAIARYKNTKENPDIAWGIQTGFTELDNNTKGMKAGEMLVVAGRHGTGKSIWLLNAGVNIFKAGHSVILFSLEMPEEQYWSRFISCYTGLSIESIETGTLTSQQEEILMKALAEIKARPNKFTIVDVPQTTVPMIAAEIDLLGDSKPDIVLVDYLGIVKATDSKLKDHEAQAQVVEDLRKLGRTLKIPILTAAQLNREPGAGKKKSKSSERLSRSDNIGATADVVIMIEEIDTDDLLKRTTDRIKLTVVKNRKGKSPFVLEVRRNFAAMRFENWDPGAIFSED